MPDYQKGKIYKITSGELTYIGSTCEPSLARRLSNHLSSYKCWKEGKRTGCSSFQLIESGQYEITLIELYPCGSKDELTARERFHIESNKCVNKYIPGRTMKEWRNDNIDKEKAYLVEHKEKIAERKKVWSLTNRDKINNRQREWRAKKKFTLSQASQSIQKDPSSKTALDCQGQAEESH